MEISLIIYLVSLGLQAVSKKIDPSYFFHIPSPPWYHFYDHSYKPGEPEVRGVLTEVCALLVLCFEHCKDELMHASGL